MKKTDDFFKFYETWFVCGMSYSLLQDCQNAVWILLKDLLLMITNHCYLIAKDAAQHSV